MFGAWHQPCRSVEWYFALEEVLRPTRFGLKAPNKGAPVSADSINVVFFPKQVCVPMLAQGFSFGKHPKLWKAP